MAYSLDLRQRVFFVKEKRGLTFKETSEIFSVDIRTLFRWQKRVDPKMTRDKRATKIDMDALKEGLQESPERFQYERAQDYGVSQAAVFYALKRLKISRKKTLRHPKADEWQQSNFQDRLSQHSQTGRAIVWMKADLQWMRQGLMAIA